MMQTNVTLEFVKLEVSDYALQTQVAFYLQLNHKGRRELFTGIQQCNWDAYNESSSFDKAERRNYEATLWTKALCQNHGDIRALHYLVGLNPGFFASAALLAHERERIREKSRQGEVAFNYGIDYDMDGW